MLPNEKYTWTSSTPQGIILQQCPEKPEPAGFLFSTVPLLTCILQAFQK